MTNCKVCSCKIVLGENYPKNMVVRQGVDICDKCWSKAQNAPEYIPEIQIEKYIILQYNKENRK